MVRCVSEEVVPRALVADWCVQNLAARFLIVRRALSAL